MKWSQFATGLLISIHSFAANDQLVSRSINEVQSAEQQARYLLQSPMAPAERERARYIQQRLQSALSLLQNSLNDPGYPAPPPYDPHPPVNGSQVDLYHSDSCSGELLGRVNSYTQCESAFGSSQSTWAVKIDGQCMDVSDMPSVKACEIFKGSNLSRGVKIFHSDSCSSNLLAIVNYTTNCSSLEGLSSAWAIEVNGQCQDISDMPAVQACERFKQ